MYAAAGRCFASLSAALQWLKRLPISSAGEGKVFEFVRDSGVYT
jgi:hypothetical protein